MKIQLSALLIVGVAGMAVPGEAGAPPTGPRQAPRGTASVGDLRFVKNIGQWDRNVRFLGRAPGVDMWITDDAVVYNYHREGKAKNDSHSVKISFSLASGRASSRAEGISKDSSFVNYFVGNDRSKWVSHAPVYEAATIKNLYRGIDLVAYFDKVQKMPRYDLVVRPGGDVNQISMHYAGAERLHLKKSGILAFGTSLGRVEERDLLAYQPNRGFDVSSLRSRIASGVSPSYTEMRRVGARVRIAPDGAVRFALDRHDSGNTLVIDPLVWSTYVGGTSGFSAVYGVATGPDGCAYVTGTSDSPDFPITTGPFHEPGKIYRPTTVAKYALDGKSLIYSTYVGGSGGSYGPAIAVDASGSVFVGGTSTSANFPMQNALQTHFSGKSTGFLFKLSPDGSSLLFSTFVNSGQDGAATDVTAMALDSGGAPIIAGQTTDTGLGTLGAAMPDITPGNSSAFCLKILSDGSGVAFGSYLTGPTTPTSAVAGLAVDSSDNIYLAGEAYGSTDFPTTAGAFQTTGNGKADGFVTKLSADGSHFVYSTLLSGSQMDLPSAVKVDADCNAYVVGTASSSDFPTTPGAYQAGLVGTQAAYISKLSPDGGHLVYSTFFGGPANAAASSMTLNNQGVVTIGGSVYAPNMPVTDGAFQAIGYAFPTGYFAQVSAAGDQLLYSSFLGGSNQESVNQMSPAPNDKVYIVGQTGSPDFPTTALAVQSTTANINQPTGFLTTASLVPGINIVFDPAQPGGTTVFGQVNLPAAVVRNTIVKLKGTALVVTPSSVVVPALAKSAIFSVTTKSVSVDTSNYVTATVGAQQGVGLVRILAPKIVSLVLSANEIIGGARNATGTVTLSGRAPTGGYSFLLFAPDPTALAFFTNVTVPAGALTAKFSVASYIVSARHEAALIALDAATAVPVVFATVGVNPIVPATLSLGSTNIGQGQTKIAKVTLNCQAPSPISVDLSVSDAGALSVPAHVTVPTGASSASFNLVCPATFVGPAGSSTVTASVNGNPISTPIQVNPAQVTKIVFSLKTVFGGYSTTGTVTLSQAAPAGGLDVSLGNPDYVKFGIPTVVTVPAGALSTTFTATVPVGYSGPDKTVTVTGLLNGSIASASFTAKAVTVSSATLVPTSVKGGTINSVLLVKLTCLPIGPTTVTLSSDSAAASVPASIVIPAGVQIVTVTVTTSAVSATTAAHITAALNGSSKTATLSVTK